MRLLICLCLSLVLSACTTQRAITIQTRPADASIRIDGVERGRAPITETFVWRGANDVRRITATRLGYKDTTYNLTPSYEDDTLLLTLAPQSKRVTILVQPAPAQLSIDGQLVSTERVNRHTVELEFTVDAQNRWTTHTVSAERPGFQPATTTIHFGDNTTTYTLAMQPVTKDLRITSNPPGAEVYLDDEPIGKTPLVAEQRPFLVDVITNQWIPQKLTLIKPGYEPLEQYINWDEGRTDYGPFDLPAKTKVVRIITTPRNPTVVIDGGPEPTIDRDGSAVVKLSFPPINDEGELRTWDVTVSKKTADSEWYPQKLTIGWDDGQTDYPVELREILTRPVPLVMMEPVRGDDGWQMVPRKLTTVAMKDVTEGPNVDPPTQLLRVGPGEYIDSLTISPDGTHLLYCVLTSTDPDDPRSQLRAIRIEATGAESQLTDGRSLELMPAYTPDGAQIVFSSNRAGRSLSIWSMSATGLPGMTQLTAGDTTDLWPSVDADPKPRLFYQRMVNTRPDARLYMTQLGTTTRTDLTPTSGMQPRISPRGDTLLFTHLNQRTGKRDIYRMVDRDGGAAGAFHAPENLTNTPDADDTDPVWNRQGTRIAFASDRALTLEKQPNYDIWILDLERPEQPMQITTNGSWDDCPVWDPTGNYIYFRSNRGGEWGIWRISVK